MRLLGLVDMLCFVAVVGVPFVVVVLLLVEGLVPVVSVGQAMLVEVLVEVSSLLRVWE